MKSMNLKRLILVLNFEAPLRNEYIMAQFVTKHKQYKQESPNWPLDATRRKMILSYWYRQVLTNFGIFLAIGLLVTTASYSEWNQILPSLFIGGFISLLTLTGFIYFPAFYGSFLPQLDTLIAEQQKAIREVKEETKCKRTQFSAPTLIVIFYTFCEIGKITFPEGNDSSAELLNKLFGVTDKPLREGLIRIARINKVSVRQRAEFAKGVRNAQVFFEELKSPEALQVLHELEIKIQKAS